MNKGRFAILSLGGLAIAAALLWAANNYYRSPQADPNQAGGPSSPPWFEDVTDQLGLDFVHDAGDVGNYFMPEQVGSGAAMFDFDGDGRLDILLLQNGGPESDSKNKLFRQTESGKFEDVSRGSGLDFNGHNMGVAIGDVNNDGRPDVLITQFTGVRFFLNQGDGTFRDATAESGIANPAWGASTAFFDYDRDGWLDLVIVCYVDYDPTWPCQANSGEPDYCAPSTFKGRVSRLFRNLGPADDDDPSSVRFEDVTVSSGLGSLPGPGLGVLCADFDGDGWPDIFIANDGEANRLWMNRRDGTFREEAINRGVAFNMNGHTEADMGIAFGDVDGDGLFDLFVSHLAQETHTLWMQGPRGVFMDRTNASGITKSHWRGTGFGTLLADFTNNGHLDLALVNGAVQFENKPTDDSLGPFWSRYAQRNQLFAGDGRGGFKDVSLDNDPFCGHYNMGRGLVKGDFDGDGGIDLLVLPIDGKARLYRNVAPNRGHWLSVRALDPALNRDALGTEVTVISGERSWKRWLHPAESYLCSSEPRAHFGLGELEKVDRIELLWPDGTREAFPGCDANQAIELRKGEGERIEP
jgi:enediyne biosynthesis protein E4